MIDETVLLFETAWYCRNDAGAGGGGAAAA